MTLSDFPKAFLLSYYTNTFDFEEYATFADALGPSWNHLLGPNKTLEFPSKFAEATRAAGMDVHSYLVQDDHLRIGASPIEEYRIYMEWGVTFLFSEFPHMATTVFQYFQGQPLILEDNPENKPYPIKEPLPLKSVSNE